MSSEIDLTNSPVFVDANSSLASTFSNESNITTVVDSFTEMMKENFDDLLSDQLESLDSMDRTFSSLSAPGERSSAEVKVRLEYINSLWDECRNTHRKLRRCATDEQMKENYFIDQHFASYESKYLDYITELQRSGDVLNVPIDSAPTASMTSANSALLPKINIPRFSGNYSEWDTFSDFFDSLVKNNKSLDDIQRYYYLKSCLEGEPLSLIKHLPMTRENYLVAWELLRSRFANKRCTINAHFQCLFSLPAMSKENAPELQTLHDKFSECLAALKALKLDVDHWDEIVVYMLAQKLDPSTRKAWEMSVSESTEYPALKDLMFFLRARIRALEAVATSQREKPGSNFSTIKPLKTNFPSSSGAYRPAAKTHMQTHAVVTSSGKGCPSCSGNHSLHQCERFRNLATANRFQFIKKRDLCTNCLGNHSWNNCRSKHTCSICHQKHHTLLHRTPSTNDQDGSVNRVDTTAPALDEIPASVSTHLALPPVFQPSTILLATAYVRVQATNGRYVRARALIDQGSMWTLVSEKLRATLQAPASPVSTVVTGVGGKSAGDVTRIVSLSVSPTDRSTPALSTRALVLKTLTNYVPDFRYPVADWAHIRDLPLADNQLNNSMPISLIIGADLYGSLIEDGLRKGNDDEPVAQKTIFGWILSGRTSSTQNRPLSFTPVHLCTHEVRLDQEIRRFWEIEDFPLDSPLSIEDAMCEKHFVETHTRSTDGRYVVRLPFRSNPLAISSFRNAAARSLSSLEKRLSRAPDDYSAYREFMSDYLRQNHMSAVPTDRVDVTPAVYLPHHGVKKETSTTTKLRVVFNASFKTTGLKSLNDLLLTGPKLQADISSVLLQWRSFRFVYTADITQMYRQIEVAPPDRDFQRILWRFDAHDPIQDYVLNTVTFGVSCAPFLAMRVLKQLLLDDGKRYPLAAPVLQQGLYVDDCLFGADDVVLARQTRDQLVNLLRGGGFDLRKWASNCHDLLSDINPQNHGLAWDKPLRDDEGIKILGVFWNPLEDTFQFRCSLAPFTVFTKRTVLSVIARMYDPLGWVAPVVVVAKILMQALWKLDLGWDSPLPVGVVSQWNRFYDSLPDLERFALPRWIGLGPHVGSIELHGFADASRAAYGAVVYARSTAVDGSVTVSLLKGKTRVSPVREISIPRLELCAAKLLAQLMLSVRESEPFMTVPSTCWSDATIVLCWVSAHPSRWQTFVANRVADIHRLAPDATWRHVPTVDNPADLASRGVTPSELVRNQLWLQGPSWLKLPPETWPSHMPPVDQDIPLEERAPVFNVHCDVNETLERLSSDTFSWDKMLNVTALILRWKPRHVREHPQNVSGASNRTGVRPPTAQERQKAAVVWFRWIQQCQFREELLDLELLNSVSANSPLSSLHPFLDRDGVIRVGGRLKNAGMSVEATHPVILRKHPVVLSIVRSAHQRCLHGGVRLTVSELRNSVWILQAQKLTRSVIHHCVICARLKASTAIQLMGDLPTPRVTRSTRPFIHCGVDYAGPIQVRTSKGRGHHSHSAYIALFICMAVKAIHLELVSDYTTGSFIAAYKRFSARRGLPGDMYSDNGTNFVGAHRELQSAFKAALNSHPFSKTLAEDGVRWHFIPPAAAHFGGLWEAGIKSVKYHLRRLLLNVVPTAEELGTLLCEIEACLNSRPLTPLNDDVDDLGTLTPGHFLVGGSLSVVPEPSLLAEPANSLSRWRAHRQALERFWKSWSGDYLRSLQHRTKWRSPRENVTVGQLVLIKAPNMPPAKWPLARVIDCHPGTDGLTRVVTLRTATSTFRRDITNIVFLPVHENDNE